MRVYRDFFSYRAGIYKHSAANRGEHSGFHSVRLVGWGEERSSYSTKKYWVNIRRTFDFVCDFPTNFVFFCFLVKNVDRCKFMGYMVGWKWLFSNTSWRQRMWNWKLCFGYVATCTFNTEKIKPNTESTILVVDCLFLFFFFFCEQTATNMWCSSYSISI